MLSFGLFAPVCEVAAKPAAKKVRVAAEPQVRMFKKNESATNHNSSQKIKPSIKARIGDFLLGCAMMWAGPFAMSMAVQHPGKGVFFRAIAAGAVVSGLTVTLAGFKKIERAIRG